MAVARGNGYIKTRTVSMGGHATLTATVRMSATLTATVRMRRPGAPLSPGLTMNDARSR
jgi:hypothetical protein